MVLGQLLIGAIAGYAVAALAYVAGAPLWLAVLLLVAVPVPVVLLLAAIRQRRMRPAEKDRRVPAAPPPTPAGR